MKLNASFRGWNCPFTTAPVWIVNASTPELAVSVQATGNAVEVPVPYGGSPSLMLTTGALFAACRQFAAVTRTSYVPAPACVIEAPEPLSMPPFTLAVAHALTVGRSNAELSPIRL